MNILQVDSSPLGEKSASRQLTAALVTHIKAKHPQAQVNHLDLIKQPIKPLDMDSLGFRLGLDHADLTEPQRTENKLTLQLIDELQAADTIAIGAPMYNFSIPAQLKNWIDRLAQAGKTFKYTEKGPIGLVTGKKVYVLSARGGFYSTSEAAQAMDHQESYLKVVLGFMGMTDITFIRAEGLGMGPDAWKKAMDNARAAIAALSV